MRRAALTAVLAVSAGLLAACGGSTPPANLISVNNGGCGGNWHLARPGWYTFQIYNSSSEAATVDLVNPADGAVYAEAEALGPETTSPMRLDVGSGAYAFRCLFEDFDPMTGPTVVIGGRTPGTPAILPVTNDDLYGPARVYHAYVAAGLATLVTQADALAADVRSGNLSAARAAWLPAHLTYERLGAAYDAFGTFDAEIDGRPDGLAGGVSSPQWTGFYRLEYGLWHGQGSRELSGVADALDADVHALRAAWPAMEIDLLDLGLRTHEILENALEFQLTGHDDYGSGTTLATTQANITGTRELLTVLHPLLAARYAGLPAVYTWLDRLDSLLSRTKTPNGQWVPVSQLSISTREQIDSACSQALEELAPIAAITEPRIT
ncbi:MAG TPA: EfeM/EfeO family lipoprotein [Streptosporangiaceae bacterium]|nr:EfeM/EfeO family lipoprotein [Streptosporangiaceae bacterium]